MQNRGRRAKTKMKVKTTFIIGALALATAAQGGEIVGVGMVVQADRGGGGVRVRSVLPAGPAAKAGIKPGSLILLKGDPDRAHGVLGAASLPWLLLANKAHWVVSEGFPVEDVEARLQDLKAEKIPETLPNAGVKDVEAILRDSKRTP